MMVDPAQITLWLGVGTRVFQLFDEWMALGKRMQAGETISDEEMAAWQAKTGASVDGFKAAGKHDRKE